MKKILIVDDAETFVEMERIMFQRTGAQIFTAYRADKALELVAREKPDVVLLDVVLPDLDGVEVCRRIKSQRATAHIGVVMITARGTHEEMERCRQAGCNDFLSKPIK